MESQSQLRPVYHDLQDTPTTNYARDLPFEGNFFPDSMLGVGPYHFDEFHQTEETPSSLDQHQGQVAEPHFPLGLEEPWVHDHLDPNHGLPRDVLREDGDCYLQPVMASIEDLKLPTPSQSRQPMAGAATTCNTRWQDSGAASNPSGLSSRQCSAPSTPSTVCGHLSPPELRPILPHSNAPATPDHPAHQPHRVALTATMSSSDSFAPVVQGYFIPDSSSSAQTDSLVARSAITQRCSAAASAAQGEAPAAASDDASRASTCLASRESPLSLSTISASLGPRNPSPTLSPLSVLVSSAGRSQLHLSLPSSTLVVQRGRSHRSSGICFHAMDANSGHTRTFQEPNVELAHGISVAEFQIANQSRQLRVVLLRNSHKGHRIEGGKWLLGLVAPDSPEGKGLVNSKPSVGAVSSSQSAVKQDPEQSSSPRGSPPNQQRPRMLLCHATLGGFSRVLEQAWRTRSDRIKRKSEWMSCTLVLEEGPVSAPVPVIRLPFEVVSSGEAKSRRQAFGILDASEADHGQAAAMVRFMFESRWLNQKQIQELYSKFVVDGAPTEEPKRA